MIIDTHCHLYAKEFEADIDDIIKRAVANGVEKFYLPAIDSETTDAMMQLETKFPKKCFAMIGLHPCSVKENYEEELHKIEGLLDKRNFAAIGETGLDFYWDKSFVKEQYIALEKQAELALKYKLPIVLHTREAMQETIDTIKKYSSAGLTGIFHCFGGTIEEAHQIIEAGFYLGIGGVITYKKSGLSEVLKHIDLKHLVLETDAPYLTPVPFRGKRNESSYLKYVLDKIAEIKEISIEEVAAATTKNAETIFGN
ncbi:MAG: TatD family hydrolase [Ferruginibacter sp.]